MKKKQFVLSILMIALLLIITIGITFAAFNFTKEGQKENTITTSTIMLTYNEGEAGIILEDALPQSDETGKMLTGTNNVFDFTVQATLGRATLIGYEVTAEKIPITDAEPLLDHEVKLYLERATDPDVTYEPVMGPNHFIPIDTKTEIGSKEGSMILDQGNFTKEGTTIHKYRLRMWIDEKTGITEIQKKYKIRINVYAKQGISAEKPDNRNPNIKNIYTYDQENGSPTFCVTGEEATCVELKKAPETYETGTIIKYKVNDTEEKYFHVMFDEGDTLTLQQRENTVLGIAWSGMMLDDGTSMLLVKSIVLPNLETQTNNWNNVLDQTYTLGTTVWKDNPYTGCDSNTLSCTTNRYTLESRTAKARIITMQEVTKLGCNKVEKSCPVWMYNYLNNSISYGGTINEASEGYWTNSMDLNSIQTWNVNDHGMTSLSDGQYGSATIIGARAIINIEK